MTGSFQRLGTRIESLWFDDNYREASFPGICARLLEEGSSVIPAVDEILDWAFGSRRLPRQVDIDSDFAEPPLTVFENDRFHISVYFWLDGTTDIHEHGFSGAFQVLHGGSLHTTFQFDSNEAVNEHFLIGTLSEQGVERLRRGDVREINPAGSTIHSLFHLDRPSVTLVVRTHAGTSGLANFRPQYSYSRIGVAWNPQYDRAQMKRRLQLLRLIQRTHPERLVDRCIQWVSIADDVSAFIGLRRAAALLSPDEWDGLLERAEARHRRVTGLVRRVVENDRRELSIITRRETVIESELRFFLALLLNVRGRANVLRIVRNEFPGEEPVEWLLRCTKALSRLPSPFENGSSALGFDLDDTVLKSLRALFEGNDFEALKRDVSMIAQRSLTKRERSDLEHLCQALRQSEMFSYVLA